MSTSRTQNSPETHHRTRTHDSPKFKIQNPNAISRELYFTLFSSPVVKKNTYMSSSLDACFLLVLLLLFADQMESGGGMPPTYQTCAREGRSCVVWVDKYFKDCLCSVKDDVSFGLGIISLVFWFVAEIPQLVTNFRNKSGHGVSLVLLATWVIGDIFNLVGCILEPATLPTQLYTALLYTAITVILVLQTIYYDYFLKWCRTRTFQQDQDINKEEEHDNRSNTFSGGRASSNQKTKPIPTATTTTSIRKDMFYTSARLLASSGTPSPGSSSSFLRVKSGPAAVTLTQGSSSDEDEDDKSRNLPPRPPRNTRRTISVSAGYGTFLAGSIGLPAGSNALMEGQVLFLGRRFLQETESTSYQVGLWLGWMMAAIYMGGRLPQIYLNVKRGSVEGLNPFMFLFALIANATYVGSILVRSVEWSRIKSNTPWLLDAIVCVVLDLFILMQYFYYKSLLTEKPSNGDEQDFSEAEKPLLA